MFFPVWVLVKMTNPTGLCPPPLHIFANCECFIKGSPLHFGGRLVLPFGNQKVQAGLYSLIAAPQVRGGNGLDYSLGCSVGSSGLVSGTVAAVWVASNWALRACSSASILAFSSRSCSIFARSASISANCSLR